MSVSDWDTDKWYKEWEKYRVKNEDKWMGRTIYGKWDILNHKSNTHGSQTMSGKFKLKKDSTAGSGEIGQPIGAATSDGIIYKPTTTSGSYGVSPGKFITPEELNQIEFDLSETLDTDGNIVSPEEKKKEKGKCTCGSESVGGGLHSSWCDKHV